MSGSILNKVDSLNGELRLQACRYGSGWMCVILIEELYTDELDSEFKQKFDDMCGGDNDYFEARDWFNTNENTILAYGETPQQAIDNAIKLGQTLPMPEDVVSQIVDRDPYIQSVIGWRDECFYCEAARDNDHKENCTYKLACEIANKSSE